MKAFAQMIQHLAAEATLMMAVFASRLLGGIGFVH
jgi:hypothetical protein